MMVYIFDDMYILLAFGFKVCHTVPADVFLLLSESNFSNLENIVIRYKAEFKKN